MTRMAWLTGPWVKLKGADTLSDEPLWPRTYIYIHRSMALAKNLIIIIDPWLWPCGWGPSKRTSCGRSCSLWPYSRNQRYYSHAVGPVRRRRTGCHSDHTAETRDIIAVSQPKFSDRLPASTELLVSKSRFHVHPSRRERHGSDNLSRFL